MKFNPLDPLGIFLPTSHSGEWEETLDSVIKKYDEAGLELQHLYTLAYGTPRQTSVDAIRTLERDVSHKLRAL